MYSSEIMFDENSFCLHLIIIILTFGSIFLIEPLLYGMITIIPQGEIWLCILLDHQPSTTLASLRLSGVYGQPPVFYDSWKPVTEQLHHHTRHLP